MFSDPYNRGTVRSQMVCESCRFGGVQIDQDDDGMNIIKYAWKEFDEKCNIKNDDSYLWAV